MFCVDDIVSFLHKLPVKPKRLLVAYSGGLDSTVLLHILSCVNTSQSFQAKQFERTVQQLESPVLIEAIHVNHNLSVNAIEWQGHCETLCASLKIPLRVESVAISVAGKGLEAAARHARYRVFEKHIDSATVLLTAHHADDQAETLLFRLVRGAGLRGLSAIQTYRTLGDGVIARPLLHVPRQDLEAYARLHKLRWISDESNDDEVFSRNYIRHSVIPVLSERWPKVVSKLTASANYLADSQSLLNEYVQQDFILCERKIERVGESISIDALQRFSQNKQVHLLRYWLDILACKLPSKAVLDQINKLICSQVDAMPVVKLDRFEMRRFNKRLFLLPNNFVDSINKFDNAEFYSFSPNVILSLPGGFLMSQNVDINYSLSVTSLLPKDLFENSPSMLIVRFRQGGERAKPRGRQHSQMLKKLLQEYKLEPWLRDIVPLIYDQDKLIAVGDLWVESDSGLAADSFKWTYSN